MDTKLGPCQLTLPAKLQKQMKYANDRNVQFVILLGENELNSSSFVLKNMETGEQTTLKFEELSSIYSLLK
jgi:histidyl-tRNA synthetase